MSERWFFLPGVVRPAIAKKNIKSSFACQTLYHTAREGHVGLARETRADDSGMQRMSTDTDHKVGYIS